jgi:hypothetical protein
MATRMGQEMGSPTLSQCPGSDGWKDHWTKTAFSKYLGVNLTKDVNDLYKDN